MSPKQTLALGATLILLSASSLTAQDDKDHSGGRAVLVYGQGGGLSALTDLDDAGTADFKTGFNAGSGIGVQLNKYVALRGNSRRGAAAARRVRSASHPARAVIALGLAAPQWMLAADAAPAVRSWRVSRRRDGGPSCTRATPLQLSLAAAALHARDGVRYTRAGPPRASPAPTPQPRILMRLFAPS